jgi:hypothetical protein
LRLAVKNSILDDIAALPDAHAAIVIKALESIPASFGRPHSHSGLGIRQLRPGIYEARIGLARRVVFTRESDTLSVQFIGNHNEVRRWLQR